VLYASSDSGEEGVLNTLWQKYENAIDKVLTFTEFSPDYISKIVSPNPSISIFETLRSADRSINLKLSSDMIWVQHDKLTHIF
jgi:hypothetical protein